MEPFAEKVIKLVLVGILILAGLLYWLLPKTRFARNLRMSEALFTVTAAIGIICGVVGLVVTLTWPGSVVDLHLWELIIMPFALVYLYWSLIMKVRKTSEIVDEKQDLDMTRAGGVTISFLIPAMAVLFIMYQNGVLEGLIWFPYFLFVNILVFSAATLYNFRRN